MYFWFDINTTNTYSVLSKFDVSSDFDDNFVSYKNNILRLVYVKKKFGFFKKDSKFNHFYLYRTNFLKSSSNSKIDVSDIDSDFRVSNKFVDLKSNSFSLFYKNRKLLKNIFFFKHLKQHKSTKILSKILKIDYINFCKFIEYSLYHILIKSKLCFTKSESIFLIKNGFVFINGFKCLNPYYNLKKSDIIQITISENFFDFFKINMDKKYKQILMLKHIIWKNHRFLNNFYKQSYNRVPDWVLDVSSFYDDVPSYIEVDYTTLSLCVLKINFDFIFNSNVNLNFLNIFMLRNYNWNYLI